MADLTPAAKPKIYLETTIPSYLTSRPSHDVALAARQKLTRDWWKEHRHRFRLFVSERVLEEAGSGDPVAAARRLLELRDIPPLELTPDAMALANRFLGNGLIPAKSVEDAFHVAIATIHRMDYLLTWNCRHIANAEIMRRLLEEAAASGYSLPLLCTPEQLMGD